MDGLIGDRWQKHFLKGLHGVSKLGSAREMV